MKVLLARACALTLAIAGLTSSASAELIYGIAAVGNSTAVLSWDSAAPSSIISAAFVTNLKPNEAILGIDVRPADKVLYALGSTGRIYQLNPNTGAAGALPNSFDPLNGFSFGFDFNPTIDRIRVVAETNKNLVVNPITGSLQLAATDLAYAAGDPNFGVDSNVVSAAYDNNFVGAGTSQLYGIDAGLNVLVKQGNNTGVLTTVGNLGVDVLAAGGFDISGTSGIAYATFIPAGSSNSQLYTINLTTGAATLVGQVDGGIAINAMAVAPVVPEPATVALAGMAIAVIPLIRRRNG